MTKEIDAIVFATEENRAWLETIKSPLFYSKGRTPARYLWTLCRCLIQDATVMKEIRDDIECLKAVRAIYQNNGIPEPEHWSYIQKVASGPAEEKFQEGVKHFNIAISNLRTYLNVDKKLKMSLENDIKEAGASYQQMLAEIYAVRAENRAYEEKIRKIKEFIQTQQDGPDKAQALEILGKFV